MKESYFNYYIPQKHIVLFYNSLRNSYLAISNDIFKEVFKKNKLIIEILTKKYPNILQTLINNGFIVDLNIDERLSFENLYYTRRFSKRIYELTINPTLDCNLKCWYCYENHKEKSKLTPALVENIITHLKIKCEVEKFETLRLNFFGGEPILKPQIIKEIIVKTKQLAIVYNFKIHIHFTTNGTIIPQSLINELKDCNVSFQITIDGNRANHDSVRVRKMLENKNGTHEIILKNIKRICNDLENVSVTIRINFSNDTFENLETLIDDLDFCDRKKTALSLHKVWQVDNNSIDKVRLFEFIHYANQKHFIVYYMLLNNHGGSSCYADNYNQAVINYDGKVFKCTARDFNDNNSEGILTQNGFISWKTDKLMDRMNLRISDNCKKCKLLPSCPGICSQTKIENIGKTLCVLDEDFSIQDYIIHNFNTKMLEAKIKAS